MKRAIIKDKQVEGRWKRVRKVLSPELEGPGVEPREFEKEAVAGERFDGPVEIKMLERVRHSRNGLHTVHA